VLGLFEQARIANPRHREKLVAALYDGQVIAQGTRMEVMQELKGASDDVLREIADDVPNLSKSELDWMASRKTGNLGGKVLKASQIRKLRGILKEKGIHLIVEGDSKAVSNLFKPVKTKEGNIIERVEGLFYYMRSKRPPLVGGFDAVNKQFILPKSINALGELEFMTTELIVFHEIAHLKQFEQLGEAHHALNELEKETYVWKQILENRGRWTKAELKGSLDYINEIRYEFGLDPIQMKL